MSSVFRNTYLKNIKEYYENKDITKIDMNDSFDKATYDLYKMMLENKSENLIDEQIKYIDSLPVPYWKMRCMFG
jgi:serine protease inhibitor